MRLSKPSVAAKANATFADISSTPMVRSVGKHAPLDAAEAGPKDEQREHRKRQ